MSTSTMTADVKERAANARAPYAGNQIVLDITTTVARFIIPESWRGQFVRARMVGAAADMVCGGSTVTCVYGQTSSVSSEAITVNSSSGEYLPDGEVVSFQLVGTHFAVDGAGTGKLYLTKG